jgi:2-desacetyl-2-hydroxyethyl bacteriochlorophyllide A dehydrogenase
MKAGVKLGEGAGNFAVKEIEKPSPGEGEVLVQMKVSGVCGADVLLYEWIYRGRFPVKPPIVLGHEGAGVIVELGKNVKGLNVGDRVTVESIMGCGSCYYCYQGMHCLCPQWIHLGITVHGTFAEYLRIPATAVHRLPDSVSFEEGALVEPLSITVHTFDRIRVSLADSVVIVGPGTLGLLHVQAARSYGASKVIVLGLEKDKLRLEKARALGADATIMTDKGDPVKQVLDLTRGIGADVVIEVGGTPESFKLALKTVRGGGQIASLGYSNYGEVEPIILARQEISILGLIGYMHKHFEQAIRWLEFKKVSAKALISHSLSLDEAEKGIHLMRDKQATKACLVIG